MGKKTNYKKKRISTPSLFIPLFFGVFFFFVNFIDGTCVCIFWRNVMCEYCIVFLYSHGTVCIEFSICGFVLPRHWRHTHKTSVTKKHQLLYFFLHLYINKVSMI